ncbi:hypothetical protein BDV96DRAFT_573544, partial [Lophiotrema nucula]
MQNSFLISTLIMTIVVGKVGHLLFGTFSRTHVTDRSEQLKPIAWPIALQQVFQQSTTTCAPSVCLPDRKAELIEHLSHGFCSYRLLLVRARQIALFKVASRTYWERVLRHVPAQLAALSCVYRVRVLL